MALKTVPVNGGKDEIMVQGFRGGEGLVGPYVFLGLVGAEIDINISVENANILGEFLRQEAEYALSVREENK